MHIPLGSYREIAASKIKTLISILDGPRSPLRDAAASTALQDALLWLALHMEKQEANSNRKRIDRAVEEVALYIVRHFDQHLDGAALAKEVGMNQNYLSAAFHERYGMTIRHYLLLHRIQYAKGLLETTTLPIKCVGDRVGMPNPQHFNKQFRHVTGLSPSEVRDPKNSAGERF